jgi:hypothetical protein
MSSLEVLSLNDNLMGIGGAKALGPSLARMPALKCVAMVWNCWGVDGEFKLMRFLLGLPNLKRVSLNDSDLKLPDEMPSVDETLDRLRSTLSAMHDHMLGTH